MTQRKDGGPAFPGVEHALDPRTTGFMGYSGMTLRDYFAAQELSKTDGVSICDTPEAYSRLADHCYRMADAMLAEREKGQ